MQRKKSSVIIANADIHKLHKKNKKKIWEKILGTDSSGSKINILLNFWVTHK